MRSTLRSLQIAFTYIGTIVGAGFATGQEILQFFTQYGRWALLTIVLSTAAFVWLGCKMMLLAHRIKARSYEDFNRHLFGEGAGSLISLFTLLILIGVNSIMLAGAGAIFQEHLGLHTQTGLILTVVGSYLLLQRGISGIMQMNSIVVPLMLTLSLVIILNTFGTPDPLRYMLLDTERSPWMAWLSPLLYTAFNLGMAQAVLVPLAAECKDERTLKLGGLIGGLGIGFMLMAAHFAMSAQMPGILQFEIPMGSIAFSLGPVVRLIYLALIFMEIFSTFVADIYGVSLQLQQRLPLPARLVTPLLMLICYIFSQFGFSSLLSVFYPLFGALALVWAFKLILTPPVPPGGEGYAGGGSSKGLVVPVPVVREREK
ncbi:hypothetical protein [Paenibacillus spiritus]|uniref:YkvI family membrane protein n=1 Tax=Paenibacillus spiritus TaxID=2496557 RepID=UPI001CC3C8AA|nr:hypothetical protein [Paenibacillus spiritus]